MSLPKLNKGKVTVSGRVNGFDVEIFGDVKDVKVVALDRYGDEITEADYLMHNSLSKPLFRDFKYVLEFKPQGDGSHLKYKIHPKKVKKSAVVENDDNMNPIHDIAKYRKRADAPDGAQWRWNTESNDITFTWEEETFE